LWSFGIAIIIHSCIDGLAIGIFNVAETIVVLAVGVVIHKIPLSISVGTTFQSKNEESIPPSTLFVFVVFILASPIGMGIGMAVGESNHDTPLLSIL